MQNNKDKEPFTSEFVDEQVERLAYSDEIHRASADQQALTPEARLVQELSGLYQEYAGTRDRVWQRLEQHIQQPSLTQRPITGKLMVYERKPRMMQRERERRSGMGAARLTLIAATVIIVLVVGSMALIPSALKTLRNSTVGSHGQAPTVTPFGAVPPTQLPATARALITPTPSAGPVTPPPVKGQVQTLPGGLQYIDVKVGTGATVQNGDTANVQYTGWLQSNSKKFDSSYDHGGQPFSFLVGEGEVIKGWDEGLIGMKVEGTRRLIIPSSLGYGDQGAPPTIPGKATLIFDITLVSIS